MEIGAILLLLAIAIVISMYLAQPFMGRKYRHALVEEHELSHLMAERDRILNALQELDFDHALNKIPAGEYPLQRAQLLQAGADVLRTLDEMLGRTGSQAEDRLEAAIASRRADASEQQDEISSIDDDDIESLIIARRSGRKERSGGFCPNCGKPMLHTDRFCPHCGKSTN